MAYWRSLASVAAVLALARPGWAQTYPLEEAAAAGKYFRVQLAMTLAGEMRVHKDGKVVPLRQAATVGHDYVERVLEVSAAGLPAKAARVYHDARAVITVGTERSE